MRVVLFIFLFVSTLFSANIKMTQSQANYIANKVWQNEGAGQDKYLVWWNKGEDFASVGIGHFIWFSKGHTERFREVFPMVVKFMENKNVKMPSWLNSKTPLPWNSKKEFLHAKKIKSKQYMELFNFLKRTMPYQAEFMAERLNNALPQMLDSIESKAEKDLIKKRFYEVMYNKNGKVNERGLYVLLDYTNFKGEGTLKSERYNGQGWGLLQVLKHMDEREVNKQKAFAMSAKAMLSRRIKNSPPARGEERWRKGWNVRLDTYWK
ncbi:hypothetical protein MNB_SV-5-668 [hydrothermal vent metagenome]|uniref:Uncharacterized protein n=1 Tax=hydrothermal vent metagenome TaxID=652676 RepID=A0A1W1EDA5_9ZZZZ